MCHVDFQLDVLVVDCRLSFSVWVCIVCDIALSVHCVFCYGSALYTSILVSFCGQQDHRDLHCGEAGSKGELFVI